MTQPTIGRIVLYTLTAQDADTINVRRRDGALHLNEHHERADGSVIHTGNLVYEGDVFPAVVVRTWSPSVNLQVLLDGNDTYWATSRIESDEPGEGGRWAWPPRV